MARKTNPNGANQYQLDPRQLICWGHYVNPKSDTFSNALQSALKAGYTEQTANQITTELWFTERVRRMNLLGKGERVLEQTLDMDTFDEKISKHDSSLLKIKQDSAKFVASTLGKDEGYSNRTEQTGKDGGAIEVQQITGMQIIKELDINE